MTYKNPRQATQGVAAHEPKRKSPYAERVAVAGMGADAPRREPPKSKHRAGDEQKKTHTYMGFRMKTL